jgi:voltage-gated potassium channel
LSQFLFQRNRAPMPQTMQPKRSETNASPQRTQSRPKPVFRFSVSYFLGALVLNILISPIVDRLRSGALIETMLITLLLLCAVLSIAGGRRALVGVVLVAPAAIGEWLNYWRPELLIYVVTRGAGLLFIGFVVVQLLRFIVYAPRVDSEVLCAAIAGYLLSGFAWSLAYALLGRLDPNSFVFTLGTRSSQSMNGFTGLYFSFITLSTVGYGDIIPVSEVARMLAIVEAMFGMFYMTLLIARLVSLYSSKSPLEITNREEILDKKRIGSENSQTTSNNSEE